MTTELEHEIRAAFAEVVPLGADPALATSIRARLTETSGVRRGPSPVVGWLAAAAVLVAVVVVAVPLLGRSSQPGPSTNPGQIVGGPSSTGPSAEPAGSARPSATASPAPGPISAYKGMFGDVERYPFRLVTDDVGVVAAGSAIYRTADGGRTWTQIGNLPVGPGERYAAISVVDEDTMYLAYSEGRVVGTHDGGGSWFSSSVPLSSGFVPDLNSGIPGVVLAFKTPTSGTVTFRDEAASRVQVFQTDDSGVTWAGPFETPLPDGQWRMSPVINQAHTTVTSVNAGMVDGQPFSDHLWLSTDGGRTWPARTFPIDAGAPAGTWKELIGTPLVEDGGRIILPIAVEGRNAIYESLDDGLMWHLVRDWPQPEHSNFLFHALSSNAWVLTPLDGSDIWSTTDGGAVWREVHGTNQIGELSTSWASVDHGWARDVCSTDTTITRVADQFCDGTTLKSVLLETIDGGATWTPIGG